MTTAAEAPAGTTQTPAGATSATNTPGAGDPAAGTAAAGQPAAGTAITGADGKPKEPAAAPAGAPEKYALKFADGVTVDEKLLSAFDPVLRELGLTNDQAQKLADVMAARDQELVREFQEQEKTARAEGSAAQAKALASDSVVGGAHAPEATRLAQLAFKQLGSERLFAYLEKERPDGTRAGQDVELVEWAMAVGKILAADTIAGTTGAGGGARKSNAEVFYGGNAKTS